MEQYLPGQVMPQLDAMDAMDAMDAKAEEDGEEDDEMPRVESAEINHLDVDGPLEAEDVKLEVIWHEMAALPPAIAPQEQFNINAVVPPPAVPIAKKPGIMDKVRKFFKAKSAVHTVLFKKI